jgi:hypothetical protein
LHQHQRPLCEREIVAAARAYTAPAGNSSLYSSPSAAKPASSSAANTTSLTSDRVVATEADEARLIAAVRLKHLHATAVANRAGPWMAEAEEVVRPAAPPPSTPSLPNPHA